MITNILLGAILLAFVGGFAFAGFFIWRAWDAAVREYLSARQELDSLKQQAIDFVTPHEEGKPSQLALAADALSSMMARALVVQFKTSMMGSSSARTRGEQAIQGDVAQDIASNIPAAAALMDSFPTLRRSLRRNPSLLDFALPFIQSLAGKVGADNHGPDGNGHQTQFTLKL